jgi:hypothetical protein
MSKIILTKINREKGFDYYIDKHGNVVRSSYNWFRDRTTLATIVLIILSFAYYVSMSQSTTNAKNFGPYCMMYAGERDNFIEEYPNETESLGNILKYAEYKAQGKDFYGNLKGIMSVGGVQQTFND